MRKSEREINAWQFESNSGNTDFADFVYKVSPSAGHTYSPSTDTFSLARFVPFGTFRVW